MHADLLNSDYVSWVEFLAQADTWSRAQIADYQLAEVRRVVEHAYRNTAGYRRLYDTAGMRPSDILALSDLRHLPLVEKETIRDRLEDFSAPGPDREYTTTSGSTGIPFGFYRDRQAFSRELASKAHQYYRVGWKEGSRQLVFRGVPVKAPDHIEYVPRFEELRCSSYQLTPEVMERYYNCSLEYKPEWIRCYPSSGYIFARFLKETDRELPGLKGVLCASENLYGFQKQAMSEAFGARVFSHYGHFELAALAGFCEYEDSYHVLPQYGFVELLDRGGLPVTKPGEIGEIVATSFLMTRTPFIRYRTRDLAILKDSDCRACGRPYQVWDRIEGRLQEFIITGTGRLISMTAINMHDDTFDSVQQFKFYQDTPGNVTLRYVPKSTCSADTLLVMRTKLLSKLGEDVELRMEPVDSIAAGNRGKYRFLQQSLHLSYGDV